MDRRELLKMIAAVAGGAVLGGELCLAGCKNPPAIGGATFTPEDVRFLDEVADTIIPTTSSPGAKAAKVGQFMTVMVNDCYDPEDQKVFHDGMQELKEGFDKKYRTSFIKGSPQQRHDFLVDLDKEAKDHQKKRADTMKDGKATLPNHYFSLMKQLTLMGYFTSKEGMTQALRYNPVPGHYEGCIDYKKGDKAYVGLGG